jgi:hypothetical protein
MKGVDESKNVIKDIFLYAVSVSLYLKILSAKRSRSSLRCTLSILFARENILGLSTFSRSLEKKKGGRNRREAEESTSSRALGSYISWLAPSCAWGSDKSSGGLSW